MSRIGETGVGEMGIGETGVGEMGVDETGTNRADQPLGSIFFSELPTFSPFVHFLQDLPFK